MAMAGYSASAQALKNGLTQEQVKNIQTQIFDRLGKTPPMFEEWKSESERKVVLEKVTIVPERKRINLYFTDILAHIAIREDRMETWQKMVLDTLGTDFEDCSVAFFSRKTPIEQFIPNFFRKNTSGDSKREKKPATSQPLVKRLDQPVFGKGLSYRHIAMWASHGYYYDHKEGKWIWQRPSLFNVIEDLNSFEYVDKYLAPMLESAGAVLVMPRERDPQQIEIIVDADLSTEGAAVEYDKAKWNSQTGGFKWLDTLVEENPFAAGNYLMANTTAADPAVIKYLPGIEQPDEYAVYVSWKPLATNIRNALYEVNYAGGKASFEVNQRMGGGWVYLGKFPLDTNSSITLTGAGQGTVTADAIKIGGGIGNVIRESGVSGMPRWAEAARYWMQYSGVPSSIYAQDTKDKVKNKTGEPKDYQDDYKSRGDWCNWVKSTGKVPLDMAVAIHTNAGINDTIFGSLTINWTSNLTGKYSNGSSKMAGRDMADIILTQITDDMRRLYTKQWTRRALYDKSYAEISRPDMPSVIVEMFSHQNFNDMRYSLDPHFRFDMARAIYKGMVKFLADRYSYTYAIQPLPPNSFYMEEDNGKLHLEWKPTADPLESTAKPTYYKLYRRIEGGFDQGVNIYGTSIDLDIPRDGKVHGFKVTALNDGGESFPTEILSAGFQPKAEAPLALVVNGFTKLSAPDTIVSTGKSGFDMKSDPGVVLGTDRGISGIQKDFDRKSIFVDNDSPGWGASSLQFAAEGVGGNTFDYTKKHAEALMSAGYSVVSCSRKAFETKTLRMGQLALIDIIMGLQKLQNGKFAVYTQPLVAQMERAMQSDVNIILSGAYIAHELAMDKSFAEKIKSLTNLEDGGLIQNTALTINLSHKGKYPTSNPLQFSAPYSHDNYHLPYLNALSTTNQSAGTIEAGSRVFGIISAPSDGGTAVSLGFPLEVLPQKQLNGLMRNITSAFK